MEGHFSRKDAKVITLDEFIHTLFLMDANRGQFS